MLDPQASRFWQAAVLSSLMDAESLTRCWNAIPPSKREAAEHIDRRLARQAVQSRTLTLWQAQQLLAGRTSGFKVDRYVLLDLIGQGGMGRVYLARDTRLNRRVALKILAPERINNPRAVARFQREARVGAQLQHENLVRVYDFGESNGRFFLVMEYIEGRTIGHLIAEQGPLPAGTAVRLVRQVALGLSHAHNKGLIHRDVNPYNIMVTHDETAKLADLGLAIDLTEEARVTRDGATVGTFDYVAPEQARHSHAADIRSDIYSLGCTLYHMLSGQVPFPTPSLPAKLFGHQALEADPVETLVSGVPPGLAEVVRTMMRKSPDERYATPMQVAQALEPYLDEYAEAGLRGDGATRSSPPGTQASPHPDEPRIASGESATPTAASSRSDEDGTVALSPSNAQPASAALSPPVVPVTLVRGSGASGEDGTQPSSASDLDRPALPLLTPVDDVVEDGDTGSIFIDLGPEPPLSDRLARSKSRSPAEPGPHPLLDPLLDGKDARPTSSNSDGSSWWSPVYSPWGVAALAVLAGMVVVLLGLAVWPRPLSRPHARPDDPTETRSTQDLETKSDSNQNLGTQKSDIIVRIGNPATKDSSREMPAQDLGEAIETAMGNLGYVELRNRRPLLLQAGRIPNLGSGGRAKVEIRAAPGIVPTLVIQLGADKAFLRTGSKVSLTLSGLDIQVQYLPGAGGARPVPLIEAGGPVTLDRCAFQVVDGPPPEGCLALAVDSQVLTVDGCWFRGFDTAIKVESYSATVAQIRQTMIVSCTRMKERRGSGVELDLAAGGVVPGVSRRLLMEHCTFECAGFLKLVPGSIRSPLEIEVKHCAVRADWLLAWNPSKPEDVFATQFQWQGEGNRFAILGHSWIVPSEKGTPALTTEVTDLDSWSKFAVHEHDPIRTELRYRTDPESRTESLQPGDFAFDSPDPPGADPDQVGPRDHLRTEHAARTPD